MARSKLKYDDVKKIVKKHQDAKLNELCDPKHIEQTVNDIVEREVFKAISGIMGFRMGWSDWEYDRSNGRQSFLTEAIKAKIKSQSTKVVEEAISGWTPTPAMLKSIKAQYVRSFNDMAMSMARANGENDAEKLLSKIDLDMSKEDDDETVERPIPI